MAFDLFDYAKRVAVRRVVYVLVALVLAGAGIGRANAQAYPTCGNSPVSCTRSEAEQAINAAKTSQCTAIYGNDPGFVRGNVANVVDQSDQTPPYLQASFTCTYLWPGNPEATIPGGSRAFYYGPKDCSTAPPIQEQRSFKNVALAGTMCDQECEYKASGCAAVVVDGFQYTTCSGWTASGQTCGIDSEEESPPPDGDGDGSSDGNDPAPHNPGQGGGGEEGKPGEDGGGKGEGSAPDGGQGNGPGEGSGNGNTAGGGGNCSSPPSVTGDAALAMVAYQGWRTACAVEKGNAEAKERAGSGTGTGTGGGSGGGDTGGVGFERGEEPDDDAEDPTEVPSHTFDVESMLDFSGFTGGGTCPDFGSVTLGPFGTHSLGGDYFCEWLPIFRALIILSAVATAIKILLGYNA